VIVRVAHHLQVCGCGCAACHFLLSTSIIVVRSVATCVSHNAAAMTLVSRCSWRCGLCACRTLPLRMVLQVPIQYTPGVFLFFCLLIPLPSPPNIIFSNSITDFVTKPLFYLHSVVLNTRLSLQPSITPHQQGKRHLYASVYFPTSCLFFSLRV